MSLRRSAVVLVAIALLPACSSGSGAQGERMRTTELPATARAALAATDGTPLIDPAELVQGAPFDRIPSVDDPVVLPRAEADQALAPQEQVLLVEQGGQARAYPVRSLIRHEIVNDELGGLPVAVTWCPLCNTGIAFDRRVEGQAAEFGVSGLLYRSALVMFDRRTRSLWPQPLGKAALGPLKGTELPVLPASLLPWQEVRAAHPDVTVALSSRGELEETANPYSGYDVSDKPFLYDGEVDPRLPAFTRVAGVSFGGTARAYSYDLLRRERAVNTTVTDVPLVVLWAPGSASPLETRDVREGRDVGSSAVYDPRVDGQTLEFVPAGEREFTDRQTGSRWSLAGVALAGPLEGRRLTPLPHSDAFWFAWAAFHTDTELVS